jgi:hypothetical protein
MLTVARDHVATIVRRDIQMKKWILTITFVCWIRAQNASLLLYDALCGNFTLYGRLAALA